MLLDEHETQTFKVMIVVLLLLFLLLDVFVPTSAHPLLFLDKWYVQIYFIVNFQGQINVSYILCMKIGSMPLSMEIEYIHI